MYVSFMPAQTLPIRPPLPPEPRSLGDLAKLMGVHRNTCRRWCQNGDVRAIRLGKHWFIPAPEFDRIANALSESSSATETAAA